MKVYISDTFLKIYSKILKNHSIENFTHKLKKIPNIEDLYLRRPFLKIKVNINGTSYRLIGKYYNDKLILVPVTITLKKNKSFGHNITWQNSKDIIDMTMKKVLEDIANGNHKEY